VYRCRDRAGLIWALKVLDLGSVRHLGDELVRGVRADFKTEVAALRGLSSRRIVPYGLSGTAGDFLFMTMGFVDRPLEPQMTGQPWSVDAALAVVCDLSDALAHLEVRGVAHRDIKPGNLGFGPDGKLLVFDFGIAALRGEQFQKVTRTAHGCGTEGYAAPEQFFGAKSGRPADIYAFGALAYELLAGHSHLEGRAPPGLDALRTWYEQDPLPLPEDAGRPPELEALIRRCLRWAPEERPTNATELQSELSRIKRDREKTRKIEELESQLSNRSDTGPVSRADVDALVPAARDLRRKADAKGRRSRRSLFLAAVGVLVAAGVGGWMTLRQSDAPFSEATAHRPAMRLVEAGAFDMGSPTGKERPEGAGPEDPVRRVGVEAFLMAETEVTQGQYFARMEKRPSSAKLCDDCPVEGVSWTDAARYCDALSRGEGLPRCYADAACQGKAGCAIDPACRGYRLPTEAEWEYAARAGTRGDRYADDLRGIAVYGGNRSDGPRAVKGDRAPNAWGLYDMLGNVWEWTGDVYGVNSTPHVPPRSGKKRVARGGSFSNGAEWMSVTRRIGERPSKAHLYLGFRVARRAPKRR